uniref:Ion transport domain-containing protein n=1 Tax=Caenorhabditis japonica TaxID=281687 RepID=A0A8R1DF22_CAEJA
MQEKEAIPLIDTNLDDVPNPITLEYCNRHSKLWKNRAEESTVFFFDYKTKKSSETLNWEVLRQLKLSKKWGVIRHPYILNYVNQKLVDCALFYTCHILAFLMFFLLLAWHIFSRNLIKDWIITVFVAVFSMFLVLKGTIKAIYKRRLETQAERDQENQAHSKSLSNPSSAFSKWFVISMAFNFLTYAATLAYIWFPTVFAYDDYHEEQKKLITWFLPIIAIVSAWSNLLYIMRKSPFGIYIFMMTRILRSFAHIATIWIPTLITFSFAFLLIMRDTGVKPWPLIDQQTENMTMVQTMLIILQAITKTSTMMIGEVDANDILDTNQWIPSILVLVFEIITVILLMNLMVSLAVGDVNYLKNTAQDKLLKIKVNFVIEALQLSELHPFNQLFTLHTKKTQSVMIIHDNGDYFTTDRGFPNDAAETCDESFKINMSDAGVRLRIRTARGVKHGIIRNCEIECVETSVSGIPVLVENPDADKYECSDNCLDTYSKWLIGLDLAGYLDM